MKILYLFIFFFSAYPLHAQFNFYFGNIHAHSSFSDGCKDGETTGVNTPKECYQFAKQSEHFDFLGISEHNHNVNGVGMQLANYAVGLADADDENDNGDFVCMYGIEFGLNEFGHVLVYGLDKLPGWEDDNFDIQCGPENYTKLWKIVNDNNAFATLAHPQSDHFKNLSGSTYKPSADKAICGTALRNGPHTSTSVNYDDPPATSYYGYYKSLLAKGYRVGPTIDHDNHNTTLGRTAASRTVILARKLHRDSIIAAYKAMRFYASEDWNTEVTLTIKDRPMGSQLNSKINPVIRVNVTDPDSSDKIDYIKVMFGKAKSGIKAKALASVTEEDFIIATHTGASVGSIYYYYAEIKQKDGDLIITAPVWVKKIN